MASPPTTNLNPRSTLPLASILATYGAYCTPSTDNEPTQDSTPAEPAFVNQVIEEAKLNSILNPFFPKVGRAAFLESLKRLDGEPTVLKLTDLLNFVGALYLAGTSEQKSGDGKAATELSNEEYLRLRVRFPAMTAAKIDAPAAILLGVALGNYAIQHYGLKLNIANNPNRTDQQQ